MKPLLPLRGLAGCETEGELDKAISAFKKAALGFDVDAVEPPEL